MTVFSKDAAKAGVLFFMSLATYHKKRDFNRTPEPAGRGRRKPARQLRFVIQKHDASRLHYDFRLELDGVLKSWAVPKGPSLDPDHKSLAVAVEDHPVDYGDFEGVIPEGEYGGGTVLLWDTGTWEPLHDPAAGLKNGKLHFVLRGKKLHGEWSLVRMHGKAGDDGKNWLLIKIRDEFADAGNAILADAPKSVKSSRSLEQIAGERDRVWSSDAKSAGALTGAVQSKFPGSFSPQLAVLAEAPPAGQQWLHEIKYDGYRLQSRLRDGKVQLITRNGKDWTAKFPGIAKALAKLKADSAILDGEVVVLDAKGRSDFQSLQQVLKEKTSAEPVLYAFDLLYCDGFDLRESPLIERKELLEEILKRSDLHGRIHYSEHVQEDGAAVVEKACQLDLEGVVSKQIDAPYVSRRDASWVKSKCGHRQELVIIGHTDPRGARVGFGSLLLGYHDDKNRLVYAGRVGTGFDEKMLKKTLSRLHALGVDKPPTDIPPPARERHAAHWVKPQLVAEIRFTGWTRDGLLRHPVFVAFRSDKPAKQIVRETPAIRLTHPDKILFPDCGTTKQDLADYYQVAAQWMLPLVLDRPLALVRCPDGLASKCFFQRNWSKMLPEPIDKIDVGEGKKHEFHITAHDLPAILAMVQMSVLEIHTWGCRDENVERPDQLIFDLDPGADVEWKTVIKAARQVKGTLEKLGLPTFVKTSGGKGLHITVPIQPTVDWDSAKAFTSTIAHSLAEDSDLFVANMRKDLRGGKVYVDFNRNGRSATAAAPYSTRARPGAPIAMPISWDELGKLKSADQFKVATVQRYLRKRKSDPWADFEKARVDLFQIIGRNTKT